MPITKKTLLLNIMLSQFILILCVIILQFFLYDDFPDLTIYAINLSAANFAAILIGTAILLGIQLVFLKRISPAKLFDEINQILLRDFSLSELSLIFLGGAFAEELLFRATIQPLTGVLVGAVLFSLIHFRYITKLYIILEVFLMGITLGVLYRVTDSLWVSVICHYFTNLFTAYLFKKGYITF